MKDNSLVLPAPPATRSPSWSWRSPLFVVGLVVISAAIVVVLLRYGSQVVGSSQSAGGGVERSTPPDPYRKLLLGLPVILATCYAVGCVFKRLGQPRVIGEIIAGILLGPSFLGLVWPAANGWLFPPYLISSINVLAQIGLIFFMFLVGRDLNLVAIKSRGHTAAIVSPVGVVVPFLCGILLALLMYRQFAPQGIGFPAFALFLAVSMSITAFPVLARILADRKLDGTPLGAIALTSAAVEDITAWCLLAVVVATAHQASFGGVVKTLVLTAGFAVLMVLVVRPVLARHVTPGRRGRRRVPDAAVLPLLLCGIMLSALATESIGIHAIFGAFLFGVITPRASVKIEQAAARMRDMTVTLLLPLFFVFTGLRTRFTLLGSDAQLWLWCLLIIVIAIAGKWGGATTAARMTGLGWRESLSLGALLNCRGLTELIVLNVGLDLGVITPTVFAMLVVMALVSTVLTSPALSVIGRFAREEGPYSTNCRWGGGSRVT
jgi:Kef-type K+ transport system membrane component KefB